MQKEDPIKLNFEGLEIQKWNKRAQRVDEKWDHLFRYNVYFQSYDLQNIKNGSFFVFSDS